MIDLVCPTRGREKDFSRLLDSVRATARQNVIVHSATNGNDDCQHHKFPDDCPTVHMWNQLALMAHGNLIMLAADDIIFSTPGWDEALINHYNALENKIHVYAFQDSRDPMGTPHPIITREYMVAMGYFVPPIFLHWYVDTWTIEIARANNCFTHMTDFLLIHDKPSDRGEADETHNRIRRMGWKERDKIVNDTCQHFLEYEKQRLGEYLK